MPDAASKVVEIPLAAHTLLRALRAASGLTQQGWAALLGCSAGTVRRWENGTGAPGAEAQTKLVTMCSQKGLFRTFHHGPLSGLTLGPELLRDLLAEARPIISRPEAARANRARPAGGAAPLADEPRASGREAGARSRPELPSGTVTFLFTDLEGQTALWEMHPDVMRVAMARHDTILRQAVFAHHGHIVKATGDGIHAAFALAADALGAALDAQLGLAAEVWSLPRPLRSRMGLHTGAAEERDGDYFGPAVNRAARVMQVAHGGQVLLSEVTAALAGGGPAFSRSLRDLGKHRLKDLDKPERLFQLVHPDLQKDFPAPRSATIPLTNLPVQMTSFIGRDSEIQTLRQLLSETRLVTLTGSGGAGKTRLALAVGGGLGEDIFRDGVFLIELASLTEGSHVAQAVATELGLYDEAEGQPVTRVTQYLKQKRTLLVLDNCEHLIQPCAELAETVLRSCPEVRVLATSREPLLAAGEVAWRVPSLSVPPPHAATTVEQLETYESVRLFTARARRVMPSFELTAANAAAVAEICRRVDGMPLAIELAAARVRILGIDQIANRLQDRLRLLSNGDRTAPERHRTLRATLDWSYDLLTGAERALFVRLAVFAGGWTLEAAESICDAGTPARFDVLDVLSRLVDKSLVVVDPDAGGSVRYRFLDSMREYALERFALDDQAAVARLRHAEYFASLAEQADRELRGPRQLYRVQQLEREHDNFRAALAWSTSSGADDLGLRLVAALTRFWQMRGYMSEGRSWLTAALEHDSGLQSEVRARALHGLGVLALGQGDVDVAQRSYQQSLDLFDALGDRVGVAMALNGFASALKRRGMLDEARVHYERSLSLAQEIGDRVTTASVLINLAAVDVDCGQLERASLALGEAVLLFHQLGEADGRGYALTRLGDIARRQGDYSRARAYGEEALALFRELGHKVGIRWTLSGLADVARNAGQPTVARAFTEESLGVARELGTPEHIAYALVSLGAASLDEGDFATARVLVDEGLNTFPDVCERGSVGWALMIRGNIARCEGDYGAARELYRKCLKYLRSTPMVPLALEAVAALMVTYGQSDIAARLLGAAAAVRGNLGTPLPTSLQAQYTSCVDSLRAALGTELYEQTVTEGAGMSAQEAIEHASAALSHQAKS